MALKKFLLLNLLLAFAGPAFASCEECWLSYLQNKSVSYEEVIDFYRDLDSRHSTARMFTMGHGDNGRPIPHFVISPDRIFNREELRKKAYTVIFINNGIHPGEPDGIAASMLLSKGLLEGTIPIPPKTVLVIIPVYNVDGAMNCSRYFRSGQNGPEVVGFRGNDRHLDLNRDFIKCDSENARTFCRIYQSWDPDVFVDTHVSDGADYQHVMTLIDSQKDKLHPILSKVMQEKLLPALYRDMERAGFPMCPYVTVWGEDPKKGMNGFLETPRYATGYSALFNAFPFVTETHMLKPYTQRIEATLAFLKILMNNSAAMGDTLLRARAEAIEATARNQQVFPLQWTVDRTRHDSIRFLGYEIKSVNSEVTGRSILQYDHSRPYEAQIPYYNHYNATLTTTKPPAYLIPQGWKEVIERMKLNGVKMTRLNKDTTLEGGVYRIVNFQSPTTPYEGHFLHTGVTVEADTQSIPCHAGDYVIHCDQASNRYIIETLEPHAPDAFFAWNFFDAILQQKEWFSDYLFDSVAAELLKSDPLLREGFEEKKRTDSTFATNAWAMYSYVFRHSPWLEPTYMRYPVLRLTGRLPEEAHKLVENKH